MKATRLAGPTLLIATLLLTNAAPAAVPAYLSYVEQTDVPGVLLGLRDDGATVRFRSDRGRLLELPHEDVMRLRFSVVGEPSKAAYSLILVNGDIVSGTLKGTADGSLALVSPSAGTFAAAFDTTAVVLTPQAPPDLREAMKQIIGAQLPNDVVMLPGGDRVMGTIVKLGAAQVVLDVDGAERSFALADVAAILIRQDAPPPQPEAAAADKALVRVDLVDGSRLSGRLLTISDRHVRVRLLARDGTAELPVGQVRTVAFLQGRVRYVSDLRPSAFDHQPLIDGEPALWTLQHDRNALGGIMTLDGHTYDKGLGMAASSRAEYRLGGAYERLLGVVGIDDAAAAPGQTPVAVVRVQVDGRVRFEQEIRPDAAAVPLDIDLQDAQRLVLSVDFGPDFSDRGDLADWAGLRLVAAQGAN